MRIGAPFHNYYRYNVSNEIIFIILLKNILLVLVLKMIINYSQIMVIANIFLQFKFSQKMCEPAKKYQPIKNTSMKLTYRQDDKLEPARL